MKYKFEKPTGQTYSEIGQPNPLRWEVLFRDGDTFVPKSGKLKCKDFFNDMVSKIVHGKDVSIYGWSTTPLQLNEDGVWLRLTSLNDGVVFEKNINTSINPKMKADLGVELTVELLDKSSAVLFIPMAIWKSTYLISLTSWLVRLANYGSELGEFDAALDGAQAKADGAIHSSGVQLVRKWGFKIPKDYQQYWYFCTKEYNSVKNPEPSVSMIHNNGVMSWSKGVNV